MADGPQVAILGAGSVGCFIGGAWAAAGLSVTLIGRERVGAEIAEHGLSLSDSAGWRVRLEAQEIAFSTKPAALKKAEVIALCVKSPDTGAAAGEIVRHASKGAAVISFQNGISNVEALRSALPGHDVLQGIVAFNVAQLGPGRWHKGTGGEIFAEDAPVTRDIAGRIGDGPGKLVLRSDMTALAWGKLLINLNNAVNALSGRPLLEQLKQRDYRRVVAASMVEALELLGQAGIEPAQIGPVPPKLLPHAVGAPDFVFNNIFLRLQKIDANARSSMADDLAAGRPTEIDYLNGEVVKVAQRLGRKAPVNQRIVDLVKQAELGVERLWAPPELRAHVLEGHRGAAGFGY